MYGNFRRRLAVPMAALFLTVVAGAQAAVLYCVDDVQFQLVQLDTSNPSEVVVVADLTGLPPSADWGPISLTWDPAKPDKLYSLVHQTGFGPFWLIEIDIATGETSPTYILEGLSLHGVAYVDSDSVTGLVAFRSRDDTGNQDLDLYRLGYDGSMSLLFRTETAHGNAAWDSRNGVLYSPGHPVDAGPNYLYAYDLASGSETVLGPADFSAGGATVITYSEADNSVYAFDQNYLVNPQRMELWRIDTTAGGAPFSSVLLGTIGTTGVIGGCAEVGSAPAAELAVTKAYLRFAHDMEAEMEAETVQTDETPDDLAAPQCAGTDKDVLRVRGTMDLSEESDGIDPLSEPVRFSAGIHTVEIPAGSFHWWSKEGAYGYAGDYDGGRVWIFLKEPSGYEDTWEYRAGFKGVDNSGTSNPMTVKLTVGEDVGETEVKLLGALRYPERK